MNEERRPEAALKSTAKTTSTMVARRRWAYSMLRRCETPCPPYGSPEWLALPEGSPYKVGAVVVAAEAWAKTGDTLAEDLWRELEDRRRLDKQHEDAQYVERAAEHRRQYRHLRLVTDWRQQPAAPRPLEQIGADYMRTRQTASGRQSQRGDDLDAG